MHSRSTLQSSTHSNLLISFSSVALSQNSQITVIKRNNYTDTNYWWLDNNNFGRTNSNLELNGNFQFDHLNSTYKINFFSEIDNENNLVLPVETPLHKFHTLKRLIDENCFKKSNIEFF